MSQHEVSQFIVIAPTNMGKAIQRAEPQLRSYLEGHFPRFRFRIEPFGPFADEEEFAIIPIMNRPPEPGEATKHNDATIMCRLDPTVIPEIQHVLRSFDPAEPKVH
jgi:hypothetical protein